ncbi:hypothetical protein F9U64_19000 [Gracilibacillus oryzae]|uniref:Prophage minor tail protein Z (GPZ) n=1 Tax=Gracilibacillus oryzae TaxID=1672701 RepID=A0A7C8L4T2_9BACI|nr:phage tail protein [Gracilibacillus oryzae]KAB8126910.1 hypothetical protein F9U64_19000 [Gracilibacillus oryzae]
MAIDITIPQLEKIEKQLIDTPKRMPMVVARSINRAAESARTQGSKFVRETYRIKNRSALDKIKIKKAFPSELMADINVNGRTLSVSNFHVRANQPFPNRGRYATVRVKKGSGGKVPGSFVLTTSSGYTNVFTRVSKARYPLKSLHGPSLPQMLGGEEGIEVMESKATEVLDQRLDHEINRLLGDK